MNEELATSIARRAYFKASDKSRTPAVEIEIMKPQQSPHLDGEYMCSFRIKSKDSEITEAVFGIDELQALQLALAYVKAKLERINNASGLLLRWVGDETGDLGIKLPVL
jgi:hypothetical protein